jgi:oleandomycin transport system permease protein
MTTYEPYKRVGLPRTARNSVTLAWRTITQLKHSPEKLLDTLLMPLVFLVLFLYVFGGAVAGNTHDYLQLLLPGLVAQMTMFGTMGLGTMLSEDINKGVFDRFRSLPIARSAPLIGAALGETIRFCITMITLLSFGVLLGFRFQTNVLSVAAALGLAYVFYLAVCWLSVLVGMYAPSPETVQGLSFLWAMPLTFGSSVFISDISTMPGWLQAWVKINPVSQLADSMRGLMLGGPVADHVLYTLLWAAGIAIVIFPLAMRGYRRHTA